jgi:hypothetical protein
VEFAGVRPLHQGEFVWPDVIELKNLQQEHKSAEKEIPGASVGDDGILRNSKQAIWVPQAASDLQLRLMVIAHSACAGHRGINATRHALQERFFWTGMRKQVMQFCSECLHCVPTRGGQVIPRALGTAVHATEVGPGGRRGVQVTRAALVFVTCVAVWFARGVAGAVE